MRVAILLRKRNDNLLKSLSSKVLRKRKSYKQNIRKRFLSTSAEIVSERRRKRNRSNFFRNVRQSGKIELHSST